MQYNGSQDNANVIITTKTIFVTLRRLLLMVSRVLLYPKYSPGMLRLATLRQIMT